MARRYSTFAAIGAVALVAALGAAVTTTGCTQSRSERCNTVCAREAECREEMPREAEESFDEKECVAACAALETDQATTTLVADHATCVAHATACEAVLACK